MNSLLKSVTRERCGCDLNLGTSAPESSTLTTRLPSQPRDMTGSTKSSTQGGALSRLTAVDRAAVYR